MSESSVRCEVFAGSRRRGAYLFVREEEALTRVPAALLESLGETRSVLTLDLHPGRKLAQSDPSRVLEALAADGYYLQLPPPETPGTEGDDAC